MMNLNELEIWYKYSATMTIIKRPYAHFMQSLYEKHKLFLTGKAELHVIPFLFGKENNVYIMPIFDFDDNPPKHEVLSFIKTWLIHGFITSDDVYVELTPHGYHVGIRQYAFGPFKRNEIGKLRDWCIDTFKLYNHLDVISSIRFMGISRTPGTYKGKRIVAIKLKDFEKYSEKQLRLYQEKLKTINISFFEEQVDKFLLVKKVITDKNKFPKFLKKFLDITSKKQ